MSDMKIYAGAVVTHHHSGKIVITPMYMQAVSRNYAAQAAHRAIKASAGYNKALVRENDAVFEEITPEWLAEAGYVPKEPKP